MSEETTMKRFSWSLTTLFVLGVASAFAQQPGGRGGPDGGHRPPPIIEALDVDRDHVISLRRNQECDVVIDDA